jgi:hypothetical protein
MENFGSEIRDKHPGSATLVESDLSAYGKKPRSGRELNKSENAFIRL